METTATQTHIELSIDAKTLPALAAWLQGRGEDAAAQATRELIGSQPVTEEQLLAWLEQEFTSAAHVQGEVIDEKSERVSDYTHVTTTSLLDTPWGPLTVIRHRDTDPSTPGCSFMSGRRTSWTIGFIGDVEVLIHANGEHGYGWWRAE